MLLLKVIFVNKLVAEILQILENISLRLPRQKRQRQIIPPSHSTLIFIPESGISPSSREGIRAAQKSELVDLKMKELASKYGTKSR